MIFAAIRHYLRAHLVRLRCLSRGLDCLAAARRAHGTAALELASRGLCFAHRAGADDASPRSRAAQLRADLLAEHRRARDEYLADLRHSPLIDEGVALLLR